MPLTPIDIQQKTFGPELRGYNMDEVDDFLDEVVATLKDYDQRVRDAQDRIRALEAEVATRGEDETAISRALVAAQKQADAIVADAHAEAESIRTDAHTESDRLRADRDAERLALTQDIARMRATVADLKRRVVELAGSAENDLDRMDAAIAEAASDIDQGFSETDDTFGVAETPAMSDAEPAEIGDWGDTSDDFETPAGPAWGRDDDGTWDDSAQADEVTVLAEDEGGEAPIDLVAEEDEIEDGDEVTEELVVEEYVQETELTDEEADSGDGVDTADEDEVEGDFGTLADRMAREASGTDDVSPSSRRPWERGSV